MVLGELQGDEARELLLAALDDWSAHVSGAALEALCKFDDPDLMSHYIAAFRPGDEVLCSAAIGVVERLKDERAVPALLDSGIKEPAPRVHVGAGGYRRAAGAESRNSASQG